MTATHTLTGNLSEAIGQPVNHRTVVATWRTNLGNESLVDLDNDIVYLPRPTRIHVDDEGNFSIDLIGTDSTGTNVAPGALRYTISAQYWSASGQKLVWECKNFALTADADLADLVETADPPAAVANVYLQQMQEILEQVEEIAGLTGEDGAVASLLDNEASATYAAAIALIADHALGGLPVFDPADYGAVANPLFNNRAAIQAAIDAAAGAGGGVVQLRRGQRYGWRGIITVKNGVWLVGTSTRQNLTPTEAASVPGLVALDNTAQLRIGDFDAGGAAKPGGVSRLHVDGNYVGGDTATLAEKGLVRISGVNAMIDNLFTIRSAGHGEVYDGLQNSTVVGGGSSLHAGCAKIMDNGCGAVAFTGGYYGTSAGGVLDARDTPGEPNVYPFGPTQCTWNGTIFEAYASIATDYPTAPLGGTYPFHVRVSGRAYKFTGCNFTAGAVTTANAAVLVDATASLIAPTATFDSCLFWVRGSADAVRVASAAQLSFIGQQEVVDDGTNHGASFLCIDGATPVVDLNGPVIFNGDVNGDKIIRTINGGTLAGVTTIKDSGTKFRLRSTQVVGIGPMGSPANALQFESGGLCRWMDPATGATHASIQRATEGGNGLFMTGRFTLADSLVLYPEQQPIDGVGVAVTINALTSSEHRLAFTNNSTAASLAITNAYEGAQLRIVLLGTGTNTVDWTGAPITFAGGNGPQPSNGTAVVVDLTYHAALGKWLETSRSMGGVGGSVAWASITGKPATFPPSAHTHATSDVTGLDTALAGKEPSLPAGGTTAQYLRGDKNWATLPTYSAPSQAEAEAGTATTDRVFTAQRVKQAIAALAPVKTDSGTLTIPQPPGSGDKTIKSTAGALSWVDGPTNGTNGVDGAQGPVGPPGPVGTMWSGVLASGTKNLDPSNATDYVIRMTGNAAVTASGLSLSAVMSVTVVQDGTGGRVLSIPSDWVGADSFVQSTAANTFDVYTIWRSTLGYHISRRQTGALPAGSWSPLSLTGQILWLEGQSVPAEDGDGVTSWANSYPVGSTSLGDVPTAHVLNGRKYVSFDGSNDHIDHDYGSAINQPFVIAMVVKVPGNGPVVGGTAGQTTAQDIITTGGNWDVETGGGMTRPNSGDWSTVVVQYKTGGNDSLRVNGSEKNDVNVNTLKVGRWTRIAGEDTGTHNAMSCAEFIKISGTIDGTTLANIETYLNRIRDDLLGV